MSFLELKNTTIGYTEPLIKNIEAQLHQGQLCLLVGNNGVGKTTLMKTILGQNPSLGGEIFIKNKKIESLDKQEIAKQISVVFSKPEVPKNYTLVDLISLGRYIHYPYYFQLTEEDKTLVNNTIEKLGLGQYWDYPLTELSDGNLQKAFIGRALVQDTPMIILDEPTTHLDEENKIKTLYLLKKLAEEEKKCILFSSHDWRLAMPFAHKIWWITKKRLRSGLVEWEEELPPPPIDDVLGFTE